jgi:thiol-disulfide isomerase/thioredoxin
MSKSDMELPTMATGYATNASHLTRALMRTYSCNMVCWTAPAGRGLGYFFAVIVLGVFVASPPRLLAADHFSAISVPAPPLALAAADGTNYTLKPFEHSVTIVHFFATWCEPCLAEMPSLRRFSKRVGASSVRVLAVSVAEPDLRVRRFVQSAPFLFPILLDRDGAARRAWQVSNLPTTVVIDSQLKQRLVIEREFDWDSVEPGLLVEMITGADGERNHHAGDEEKK